LPLPIFGPGIRRMPPRCFSDLRPTSRFCSTDRRYGRIVIQARKKRERESGLFRKYWLLHSSPRDEFEFAPTETAREGVAHSPGFLGTCMFLNPAQGPNLNLERRGLIGSPPLLFLPLFLRLRTLSFERLPFGHLHLLSLLAMRVQVAVTKSLESNSGIHGRLVR
jgi:hypothetical protein